MRLTTSIRTRQTICWLDFVGRRLLCILFALVRRLGNAQPSTLDGTPTSELKYSCATPRWPLHESDAIYLISIQPVSTKHNQSRFYEALLCKTPGIGGSQSKLYSEPPPNDQARSSYYNETNEICIRPKSGHSTSPSHHPCGCRSLLRTCSALYFRQAIPELSLLAKAGSSGSLAKLNA